MPLPTAVGPASTVSRAGVGLLRARLIVPPAVELSGAEPLDERRDLVRPEAPHAAGLGDPDLFHDRPALTLPTPGSDSSSATTFSLPMISSVWPS